MSAQPYVRDETTGETYPTVFSSIQTNNLTCTTMACDSMVYTAADCTSIQCVNTYKQSPSFGYSVGNADLLGAYVVPDSLILVELTGGTLKFPTPTEIYDAQGLENFITGGTFFMTIFNAGTSGNIDLNGCISDPQIPPSFADLTLGTGSRNIFRVKIIDASNVWINRISTQ